MNSVKERIRALAEQRGSSLSGVEKELGIGNGTIGRWDASAPTTDKLEAVADFFDVSVDYLLGRDEPESNDVMLVRERLRNQPGMRMLFDAAEGATAAQLEAVAKMIEAWKES